MKGNRNAVNGVIAYGLDQFGNWMPLPSSSVPSQSEFGFQARKKSLLYGFLGNIGTDSSISLPGVGEDEAVFIHGFDFQLAGDGSGSSPLNIGANVGLFDHEFFSLVRLFVGDEQILMGGTMGDIATAIGVPATIFQDAPGNTIFTLSGGYMPVNKLIPKYVEGIVGNNVQLVADSGGSENAYMTVRCVYSPLSKVS